MGCFSFLCKESGKAALSTSFDGSPCRLFLLKKGKVIEEMHGNYDSYGHVFNGKGGSFKWKMDWGDVCDLTFSSDPSNGIAAVLDKYWTGIVPTSRSEDDPNQGWGGEDELEKPMTAEEFLLRDFSSVKVRQELQRLREEYLRTLEMYLSFDKSDKLLSRKSLWQNT